MCVLLEQGEHGYLAARVTSEVIKSYVEKQRRLRNNPTLFSDKDDPGSVPVAGFWTSPSQEERETQQPSQEAESPEDHLHGGTLLVKMSAPHSKQAKAALPAQIGVAGEH